MQGELWGLGLEEFTIGEMFQEYGYKTHAIGKIYTSTGYIFWLKSSYQDNFCLSAVIIRFLKVVG